jgi:hypothetical protein
MQACAKIASEISQSSNCFGLEQGRFNIAGYRSSGIKATPKDFQVREMIRDE